MNSRAEKLEAFGRLLDIMDTLRAECPRIKSGVWNLCVI